MKPDTFGKYVHEKTRSDYLELKPDGNYFLFEDSEGVTGKYEVDGTELTIFTADSTSQAEIQGGVITDADGERWIRAKPTEPAILKCPNCKSDLLATAKFCSNCGTVLNAPVNSKASIAQQRPDEKSSDDPLASISWMPAILKRDLPWELFEAGAWVVVLVLIFVFVR